MGIVEEIGSSVKSYVIHYLITIVN
jgi:hypothetical protein